MSARRGGSARGGLPGGGVCPVPREEGGVCRRGRDVCPGEEGVCETTSLP